MTDREQHHGGTSRHVSPVDVERVLEPENGLSMRALVTGRHSGDALSLTEVELDGVHRRLRSRRTTRTYYVLEGSFDFQVERAPGVLVRAGEALVLAAGTAYGLAGRGRYLVLNTPAFRDGDDEYLDGAPSEQR
jgi:quercetin dioxygenase-like cupin family protein